MNRLESAACDLSPTAIAEATRAGSPVRFFVHDVLHDRLPDGFDVVSLGSLGGTANNSDQFFVNLSMGEVGLNYNYGELLAPPAPPVLPPPPPPPPGRSSATSPAAGPSARWGPRWWW